MTAIVLALGLPVVLVLVLKYVNPPFWGWQVSRTLFPPQGYPQQSQHQWIPLASVIKNRGENGPDRGASTITQQTAKNVFLFPSHTYIRKAYELYISLLLELIWGKERIMEMYLNVVEFGPGIYGIQAASEHYFGVSANHLTRYQAAQLAVVLPNPYRIQPYPMTHYVQQRVNWVLRQMQNLGAVAL
ncbi:transglycosylase domain-containing protein [Vibrio fluvialis]|nr:transglycosylase domain-containing protein [Vibrio fluvialis]